MTANRNASIWVLTNAGETENVFASLDDAALDIVAPIIFDWIEDENDPDMPKSVEETKQLLHRDLVENGGDEGPACVYMLKRTPLNTIVGEGSVLFEDPEFKAEKGAVIYEAVDRIIFGCDMNYALAPVGYFTRKVEIPDMPYVEWIERPLL